MKSFRNMLAWSTWIAIITVSLPLPVAAAGDADAGARVFGVCAACHSLEPGRHMTGPSLADLWERQAGSIADFGRYSEAMRESELTWNADTIDNFISDPQALVPGNRMLFRGIENAGARADLVAFLEQVTGGQREQAEVDRAAGSRGMMRGPAVKDLKALGAEQRVASIRYCGDSYYVTTEAGRTFPFWEFNLRFKTDSSDAGPYSGQPVIISAGMRGDRAFVVFAGPNEFSRFIGQRCD